MSNQAPWILIVQFLLVNSHNLELLNQICTDCIIVDALIKWAFLGYNFKLADSQVECTRYLHNYLPDLHVGIDHDLLGDILRIKLHCDLNIVLFIVFFNVFQRYVHVIESLDVFSDQSYPIESHFVVSWVLCRLHVVKLQRNLLCLLHKALNEDALVFLLNNALQVDIDKEIARFVSHMSVTRLDGNGPQGFNAKQILEVHHVDDFERS